MNNEIIKVLEYISAELGVAIDWTTENILPYAKEVIGKFVNYKIVYHSIGLAIGLSMFIFLLVVIIKIVNGRKNCLTAEKNNFWWEQCGAYGVCLTDGGEIVTGIAIVIGLVGIFAIFYNGRDLMQWSIVPEIALLEEVKCMLG